MADDAGESGWDAGDVGAGTGAGSDAGVTAGAGDAATGDAAAEARAADEGLTAASELYDAGAADGPTTELYDAGAAGDGPTTELMEPAGDRPSDSWEDIDFTQTANTPAELQVLHEMAEAGELEVPEVDRTLEPPEFAAPHLPTEATGRFEGERGDSDFIPASQEARDALAAYGRDAVAYVDGQPDFSPFVTHGTPYGWLDCEVEIGHMTTERANPSWDYGRRPAGSAHDLAYDLGNFNQADVALADRVLEERQDLAAGASPEELAELRGRIADELASYRAANGLTWHECADGKTMQLVPTEIHDACRHSGGVSTMRTVGAYGDVRLED